MKYFLSLDQCDSGQAVDHRVLRKEKNAKVGIPMNTTCYRYKRTYVGVHRLVIFISELQVNVDEVELSTNPRMLVLLPPPRYGS